MIRKMTIGIIIFMMGFQHYLFSQTEKDVVSKITKVTVYSSGAQIESEAKLELQQGKVQLSFKNLSPYINKESIRVEGEGKFTILNVQLRNDYINGLEKGKEMDGLNASIQQYMDKIEDEETWIKISYEKIDFLKSNKTVAGSDKSIEPETFKSLNSIYGDNMEKYTMDILKRQRLVKEYRKEVEKLKNQLNSINSQKELPSGVISVMVDSKINQTSLMKLSYLVENSSWYPSYDIRFQGIDKPLAISYKANIKQNTGIDWKNIDLKLSTAKTNLSAQIPTLSANYLQFYQPEFERELKGRGAGMEITGTPDGSSDIKIRGLSSVASGNPLYIVDGVAMDNIGYLNPNDIEKMDVLNDDASTGIYGSRGANGVILVTTKKESDKSKAPLTFTSKNETSIEFAIETPQSINSDDKLNGIMFKETELQAVYEYQAIPKLSKNVFLIAKISDWNKADLADGETNLYFENSFIGNSTINTRQFSDTLDISFGIDNNITVNREKIKDFSETQFIGSNKKVTTAWKLTVRNNKAYPVKLKLNDQVPLSSNKDIQVEAMELTGGTLNKETGMVEWIIDLKANESRQIVLKYFVKYPKDKVVVLE